MNIPGNLRKHIIYAVEYTYADESDRWRQIIEDVRDWLDAQPALVPEDVLDTLDNALNKLAYYVGDSEIKRARAWLDSLPAADEGETE